MKKKQRKKLKSLVNLIVKAGFAVAAVITAIAQLIQALKQ